MFTRDGTRILTFAMCSYVPAKAPRYILIRPRTLYIVYRACVLLLTHVCIFCVNFCDIQVDSRTGVLLSTYVHVSL